MALISRDDTLVVSMAHLPRWIAEKRFIGTRSRHTAVPIGMLEAPRLPQPRHHEWHDHTKHYKPCMLFIDLLKLMRMILIFSHLCLCLTCLAMLQIGTMSKLIPPLLFLSTFVLPPARCLLLALNQRCAIIAEHTIRLTGESCGHWGRGLM